MNQWVVLVMASKWHEDGIAYAVGPFATEAEACAALDAVEHGYSVELRGEK